MSDSKQHSSHDTIRRGIMSMASSERQAALDALDDIEEQLEAALVILAGVHAEAHSHKIGSMPRECPACRFYAASIPAKEPQRQLVYCKVCHKTHAVLPDETPCATGAWSEVTSPANSPDGQEYNERTSELDVPAAETGWTGAPDPASSPQLPSMDDYPDAVPGGPVTHPAKRSPDA